LRSADEAGVASISIGPAAGNPSTDYLCDEHSVYTLLPFGQKAVSRADYSGRDDIGTGPLGVIGNVVWFVLAGWWLALGHLVTAILLAVTIIGIPFAWAHLKLAGLALWPVGKVIVPADDPPYGHRS